MTYDADGNLTQIVYTTGNKQTITYNGDPPTSIVFRYYGTNGTTLLATYTINFQNNQAVSTQWS